MFIAIKVRADVILLLTGKEAPCVWTFKYFYWDAKYNTTKYIHHYLSNKAQNKMTTFHYISIYILIYILSCDNGSAVFYNNK